MKHKLLSIQNLYKWSPRFSSTRSNTRQFPGRCLKGVWKRICETSEADVKKKKKKKAARRNDKRRGDEEESGKHGATRRRCRGSCFLNSSRFLFLVERKPLSPNGECRRAAFTTGTTHKGCRLQTSHKCGRGSTPLPRPLSNKCSSGTERRVAGHYSGSSRSPLNLKTICPDY